MVLQLLHAGILEKQQALVLGDFSAYRLTDYDNGYDFAQMLTYLRAMVPIPVLCGLPFGHTVDKATLAVGAACQLRSDQTTLSLKMSGYPYLRQD
jgi:muramoyltetrapeptide carboxypeptidase